MAMKKVRMFKGNVPGDDFDYESSIEWKGIQWDFYKRDGNDYVNVKIIASESAPKKANFWISFHIFRGLLVINNDLKIIEGRKEMREELYRILGVKPSYH